MCLEVAYYQQGPNVYANTLVHNLCTCGYGVLVHPYGPAHDGQML